MAAAFDAVGPSSSGANSTGLRTLSWSHTVTGTNTAILAAAACGYNQPGGNPDTGATVSATFGGVPMTQLALVHANFSGTSGFIAVFGLAGAAAGAGTVIVTEAGGNAPTTMEGGSLSFTGVSQVTPFGTAVTAPASAVGTQTTATATVSSTTSGNIVAGFAANGSGTTSAASPSTSRFLDNFDTTSAAGNIAGATSPSTGSAVTTAWTIVSDWWAAIAVEVLAAPAAAAAGPVALPQVFSRNWRRRHRRLQRMPEAPPPQPPSSGASLTVTVTAAAATTPPFLTSVAGAGDALYFADQFGAPYQVRWDTVWSIIANAGNSGGATTWQSDIDGYCAARAAQGFNGFLFTPTGTTQSGAVSDSGVTWDGVAPFSSPGVLNGTFWTRVDYLLASAQASGLTVIMNAMFTYAMATSGGPLNGWTNTQYGNYGTAAGARYASQANLVWEVGDDYGASWIGGQIYDTAFSAFLAGLRGAGANQLITIENSLNGTSRYPVDGSSPSYPWGISNAQFNFCYDYNSSYNAVEDAYKEAAAHSVPPLAVVKMDGWYDNGWYGNTPTESVGLFGRKWLWWVLSSGSRGAMYGNNDLFTWPANALSSGLASASPGAQYIQPAALNTIWDTFASFTGWNLLVPDTSSALVTAGRGTRSSEFFAGTGPPGALYLGGNTWVTASRTPDAGSGSALAVIYVPAHTTITVDQTKMMSGYTATWIDPASGASTSATPGSTYNSTSQGSNSAGDPDWVLVLQAPLSGAFTGTASLAVTATLSAAGNVVAASAASLTATVTLAAAGSVATASPASLAVTAALASAGGTAGPASLLVTATPAAAGNVATASGASLAATASLTATPAGGAASATALAVTAALSATGTATGTAPLAVAAALTAAGSSTLSSGAALAIAVTTAAAGTADGTTSLAVAVALAAAGTVATASGAPLAVAVSLTAAPAGSIASGAALAVSMTAAAAGTASGAAGLPVTVTLAAAGSVTAGASGAASLAAAVTLAAAGNVATSSAAVLSLAIAAAAAGSRATGTGAVLVITAARATAGIIPPPFTTGTLTASDAPAATLTASDTRTGGPS